MMSPPNDGEDVTSAAYELTKLFFQALKRATTEGDAVLLGLERPEKDLFGGFSGFKKFSVLVRRPPEFNFSPSPAPKVTSATAPRGSSTPLTQSAEMGRFVLSISVAMRSLKDVATAHSFL